MLHVVWNVVEVRWVARTVVVLRSPRTICRRIMMWWLVVGRWLVVLWLMVRRLVMRCVVRMRLRMHQVVPHILI